MMYLLYQLINEQILKFEQKKQLFECIKETEQYFSEKVPISNMEENTHCFPLLNVIKSHENLMPRIGHDFVVVDFESAGQFSNNVITVGHYAAH